MANTEERTEVANNADIARAVGYRFLAHCFTYPDRELVGLLDGTDLNEYVSAWRTIGFDASREMAEIMDWRSSMSPQEALQALQEEHTRLFVNAFPRVPAPPYSSVYLDQKAHPEVWGDSTVRAVRFYEAAGLYPAADFNDIPDHIAAELEFVSYLISAQQNIAGNNASQNLADIEKTFLADHLFLWAPVFFSRVMDCNETTFYKAISTMAHRFIEGECYKKGSEAK
jgi:DMSO reductase family type II enzyme chaperone